MGQDDYLHDEDYSKGGTKVNEKKTAEEVVGHPPAEVPGPGPEAAAPGVVEAGGGFMDSMAGFPVSTVLMAIKQLSGAPGGIGANIRKFEIAEGPEGWKTVMFEASPAMLELLQALPLGLQ